MNTQLPTAEELKIILTKQEYEVLKLATEDLSNKELADKMTLSVGTIKKHKENICKKLNVHGRHIRQFFIRLRSIFKPHS